MLEHIRHDVGEIFLRDELLLVAQFDDAVSYTACLFGREFKTQFLKVLENVRLARILAQRILAFSAKTLGQEVVAVEVVLVVAIGMHSCHLREDTLADDWFVGRNGNARQAFHHRGHLAEVLFFYIGTHMRMVFQNGLHRRDGCIASPFAKSVHCGVDTPTPGQHGCQHIARGQVVVVMGMEVKLQVGVAACHLTHEGGSQLWIENAQCVGQHETLHATILQCIDKAKHIVGTVLHAIRPILHIEIHADTQLIGIGNVLLDVSHMLFKRLLQLKAAMPFATLAEQVDILASAVVYPIE